jgi:hypothetical protein
MILSSKAVKVPQVQNDRNMLGGLSNNLTRKLKRKKILSEININRIV